MAKKAAKMILCQEREVYEAIGSFVFARVRDWRPSSFHRMVRRGIYPEYRAGDVSADGEVCGERSSARK